MVYVFFAEGFEEIEALTVVDVLRRADIRTHMIGVNHHAVTGAHGITVQMDATLKEISGLSDASMLILPGGMPGTTNLIKSDALKNLLVQAYDSKIHLAAICAAPMVLSEHGLLKGRKVTCYPGFEERLKDCKIVSDEVVCDHELITGKGAGVTMAFALKIVEVLKGHKASENLAQAMIYKTFK